MSEIATEHNGRKVTYSENGDVWRCWEMDLEAKTLSELKVKMNKVDAEARRVGNVPVLYLQTYRTKPEELVVTMIDGESVWTIGRSGRSGSGDANQRAKRKIEELMPDTAEVRAALAIYEARVEESRRIGKEADALKAAIPRLTIEHLKAVAGRDDGVDAS